MVSQGKAEPKDFDRELPTGASTVQAWCWCIDRRAW